MLKKPNTQYVLKQNNYAYAFILENYDAVSDRFLIKLLFSNGKLVIILVFIIFLPITLYISVNFNTFLL
ncbi:hypothetical protein DB895_07185 [Flavobacterium psychrotolerans]|uniref:Uncharacterized protein n=1 Tax=Flavobacterium psychrotolerans TaxID=2169410 RepID=A0A2U1JJQ6_9FLAO|nr:hypothetical protein DB895_07185 [Flavobacterium psychrotolerans]